MATSSHRAAIDRFKAACQADERVVAAFLGGSYAAGTADAYSDLDLYLIVADASYDDFFAQRRRFLRQIGDPVFLDDFNGFGFDMVLFIFADGVDGELALARASRFDHVHGGPVDILLDRGMLLLGTSFPLHAPTEGEQRETLRRLVHGFWRDLWKFGTALARGRLWSAYSLLEKLRRACFDLARLERDFGAWAEGYWQAEQAVDPQALAELQAAFGPVERRALLDAAHCLIRFYLQTVPPLAGRHGVAYPAALQVVVERRLESLFA